jgi:hypothetical protein
MSEGYDIDLGSNHWLKFFGWSPDRLIESDRVRYEGIADVARVGALVLHLSPVDHTECSGFVHFDLPEVVTVFPNHPKWQVVSWEPLTLSPSILCRRCGDHGFIRNGKWEIS